MQTLSPTFAQAAGRTVIRSARRALALAAMVTATAAFAQAPEPVATPQPAAQAAAAAPGNAVNAATTPARAVPWAATYKVVSETQGSDINGDGQPDFVNPTGQGPRGKDSWGSGAFMASRGGRAHAGVDYVAQAGQKVIAPIAGSVTRIGYAYADDMNFRYVEITNRATGYMARVMYVGPEVQVGEALDLGETIGKAQSLNRRYPAITNHVHLEIARLNGRHIDAARLIPARA